MTRGYRRGDEMLRLIQMAAITLAVFCASGCGSPRPIRYYGIQVPSAPTPAANPHPVDLVVGRMIGSALLESEPIVYRIGANTMGTYQYHRWEDAPVELVPAKLVRMLRSTGEYRSVAGTRSISNGEYVIRGRLHQFEEVDGPEITGQITMEFELYDRKAGKLLWSHYYSRSEPAQGKEVTSVVEAIDRNLDRGLKEVVTGLTRYFAANPPKKS
jgi:ABC-type uncharacterized transport system auxiliary subunit